MLHPKASYRAAIAVALAISLVMAAASRLISSSTAATAFPANPNSAAATKLSHHPLLSIANLITMMMSVRRLLGAPVNKDAMKFMAATLLEKPGTVVSNACRNFESPASGMQSHRLKSNNNTPVMQLSNASAYCCCGTVHTVNRQQHHSPARACHAELQSAVPVELQSRLQFCGTTQQERYSWRTKLLPQQRLLL
jgi:hypothetical protein